MQIVKPIVVTQTSTYIAMLLEWRCHTVLEKSNEITFHESISLMIGDFKVRSHVTTATAFFEFNFVVVAVTMNGYGTHSSATSQSLPHPQSQSQEQCERLHVLPSNPIVTTKKTQSHSVNGPLGWGTFSTQDDADQFPSRLFMRHHFI